MLAKNKSILWGAIGFFIALLCFAVDYGSYLCRGCAAPMNPIDTRLFISVYVNPRVPMWQANDTVTICNGLECVKYFTPTSGATTWTPIEKRPDPGRGYSGEGVPVGGVGLPPDAPTPVTYPFPTGGSGPGGVVIIGPIESWCPPFDLINCA